MNIQKIEIEVIHRNSFICLFSFFLSLSFDLLITVLVDVH